MLKHRNALMMRKHCKIYSSLKRNSFIRFYSQQQLKQQFATQQLHSTHFTKQIVYQTTTTTTISSETGSQLETRVEQVTKQDGEEQSQLQQHASPLYQFLYNHCIVHLLPQKYPQSVRSNYLTFCKWQSLQYVVSSMGGVLSMQAMLHAIGIGSGAVPLAAALNWIIKDGIGQLGGVIFASRVNTNFDSDPKQWRVRGEFALLASTGLEICTPLFPKLFIPLAAIANIGKNVSCLASSATRAAINNSFITMDNLADVTAKSASQAIASSLIGTALAICISPLIGTTFTAVFPAFLALSAIQLFALYRAVRLVQLNIFNLQRLELVLNSYLSSGIILDPEKVAEKEQFIISYKSVMDGFLIVNPRLDVFCFTSDMSQVVNRIQQLQRVYNINEDKYLLNINPKQKMVSIIYVKSATTDDVIRGILQASIIRKKWSRNTLENDNNSLDQLLSDTRAEAQERMSQLRTELINKGWILDNDFIEARPDRVQFHH
jgi:hypothetical protein